VPATFDPALWPSGTVVGETDVTISGLSLDRLAAVFGTPSVHDGTAGPHRTDILVTRVVSVHTHPIGLLAIRTDAYLDELSPVWSALRLLGRTSTAASSLFLVSMASQFHAAELPLDLRVGDLLAVPCVPVPVPVETTVPEVWLAQLG
jgi:hypothetical protein